MVAAAKTIATKKKTIKKAAGKQAVIKLGGKQYLVSVNDELRVEKIDKKVKSIFTVPDVLAVLNEDSDIDLGTPRAKTKVTAEVLEHGKGDKIYVIKYKPKIRYRRKTGHRQRFTCIKIISIG